MGTTIRGAPEKGYSLVMSPWNVAFNDDFVQRGTGTELQYIGGKNGHSHQSSYLGCMKGFGKKAAWRLEQWVIGEA